MRNNVKDSRSLYCNCGVMLTIDNVTKGDNSECKPCQNLRKSRERKERQTRYQWNAVQRLGGKCEGCGKEATIETMVCFDFHHINKEDKNDSVANMLASARPLSILLEEVDKCILFCACCHRLHHQKYGY